MAANVMNICSKQNTCFILLIHKCLKNCLKKMNQNLGALNNFGSQKMPGNLGIHRKLPVKFCNCGFQGI